MSSERIRRLSLIVAGTIFVAIIIAALALASMAPITVPPSNQTQATPYVVVEEIIGANTTYATTFTTTPHPVVYLAVHPEVVVVVNGTQTYTITTTVTSTVTTWE